VTSQLKSGVRPDATKNGTRRRANLKTGVRPDAKSLKSGVRPDASA